VFGGVFVPNRSHELYSPGTPWQPYGRAAGSIGLRVAYLPIPYVGAELDAAVMPTTLSDGTGRATLFAVRGHVIGQLPLASVVPFVLVGAGGLGARSGLLGSDVDLASHFGGGVKLFVHRYVGVRLDVRGTVTSRYGTVGSRVVHPEVLLGVVIPLGLQARDSDGDGSYDPGQRARPVDRCPDVAGSVRYGGCADGDVDTVADPDDRCPGTPGLGERHGCPALTDGDRDGVFDPGQVDIPPPGGDKCPDLAGLPAYIGCPAPDSDGDGVVDPDDACVGEREVFNGFKDEDGCPDEVPVDVATLIGTLRGITFAFMSDTITEDSRPALDHAVDVMRQNPTIRIEVQGHTDDEGDPGVNLELSRRRAEAVRRYIVAGGIDEARVRWHGYGGTRPLVENKTEAGKARNRRIELRLIDANNKVIVIPQ
jgi:outer membrane protein OmpA-like peptidoglycan-associated protein